MQLATDNQREYSAHQKSSFVAILLKDGSLLTTAGIARLTGMSWQGAEKMMNMISGVLPIVKVNRHWQWIDRRGNE
jgi:hypothetical protein